MTALKTRRVVAGIVLTIGCTAIAGCDNHHVALIGACPTAAQIHATALPKIGLTQAELKLQEKCH